MADGNPHPRKLQKLNSQLPTAHHANPSKFVHHFLYKATTVTIFLVILPLLPSILPEFINQNIHSTSWELLQLIFVGIAVSYGLFSKKNEGIIDKEYNYSLFDNANSYVNTLLQVSPVFYDEAANPLFSDDNSNKFQTWSSQYYRGGPVAKMVSKESLDLSVQKESKNTQIWNSRRVPEKPDGKQKKESLDLEDQNGAASSRIDEKPLLLPVRSLKSRVSASNAVGSIGKTSFSSRSESKNSGSKRFPGSSRKSANGNAVRSIPPKMEEKTVHPSPIPWRSRSGRMEMTVDSLAPSVEASEIESRKSGIPRYSDFLEMDSKSSVGIVSNEPSRSQLRKSNSGCDPMPRAQGDISLQGKSMRTVRPKSKDFDDNLAAAEVHGTFMKKQGLMDQLIQERIPDFKKESLMEDPGEETKKIIETVRMERDVRSENGSEEDDFEGSLGSSGLSCDKENRDANDNGGEDEGPDVDKKADEFIAKFREQIRLQRIESIRRSTEQHSINHSR